MSASGRWFRQLTVVPVLLAIAWLVPGLALLLAGQLRPAPMVLVSAPLAVVLIAATLRRSPGQPMVPAPARPPGQTPRAWTGWWGLAGTVAVAAGFGAWQILLNSPQLIVLRDPGALFQLGYWMAGHGSLPIPDSLAAFGGAHPGLTFASTGFSRPGAGVTGPGTGPGGAGAGLAPQFMPGLAIILAGGSWAGGTSAAVLVPPVLGALAVLTFGGLAGRLAGPQWAPAAAFVLALTLPEVYTSRSAFTEPLVQLLLFGGLGLVIDSLTARPGAGWRGRYPGALRWPGWLSPTASAAALGGLAIGLTSLVSLAAAPGLIAVVPFLGAAVVGRRPQMVPIGIGLLAGLGCGVAAARLAAPAYLDAPGFSIRPISLIAAGVTGVTLVAVLAALWEPARSRVGPLARAAARWWVPELAAVAVAAGLIFLLVRPSVQTPHTAPGSATTGYVGALQKLLGLPVQPTRSYAEDSLYWVIWYIGIPALLLGGFGLVLLVRRCVRALLTWTDEDGTARLWALPLSIIIWVTASVLWAPDTVPDQPWASRLLVPVVLPGFILCGIWVAAWLGGRARERGAGTVAVCLAAACFVVALAVPTAVTTLGFTFSRTAPRHSAGPAATGLGVKQVGAGQSAAVQDLCGAMSAQMTVVIVDRVAADEFAPAVRGMCGVPTGVMAGATPAEVQSVLRAIAAAGREPVLLATRATSLAGYGATPRQVVGLRTTQDPHDLTQPPTTTWQISYVLWMSVLGGSVPGA